MSQHNETTPAGENPSSTTPSSGCGCTGGAPGGEVSATPHAAVSSEGGGEAMLGEAVTTVDHVAESFEGAPNMDEP